MFQLSEEWLPTQLCQTKQKVSELRLGVCLQVNVKILVLLIKLRSIAYINLWLYSNKGGWLIENFECFAKFWIPFRRPLRIGDWMCASALFRDCAPGIYFNFIIIIKIKKLLLIIIIKLKFFNWSLQKKFNWLYIKF